MAGNYSRLPGNDYRHYYVLMHNSRFSMSSGNPGRPHSEE